MNKIKGWLADFTGIAVALIALGIVAGVVFGDVPFVGAILGNVTDLAGTLGDSGAVGALVLALLVGLYN
jgi:hypothetical protein